jgi:acetyl esterase/lipase
MFVLRRIWRLMALLLGRGEPVAAATDREILGPVEMIRLRVIRPDGSFATRPGFLWCHGGGFSLAVNSMLDAYGVTSALASTQEGV